MGLDLYVGGLVRYYTGEWELVMETAGRQHGLDVRVDRPNPLNADPVEARDGVLRWQSSLARILGADGIHVDWDEAPDAPYFTDKPDWFGFGGLLLWAAHDDRREENHRLPTVVHPTKWKSDAAYRASVEGGSGTRYPNLLCGASMWLPGRGMPFRCPGPKGDTTTIGFVDDMIHELLALNARTWRATPQEAAQWRAKAPDPLMLTEEAAKVGFAIVLKLAFDAQEHGLPMLVDA